MQNKFPGPSKSDTKYIPHVHSPLVMFLNISDLNAFRMMGQTYDKRRDREGGEWGLGNEEWGWGLGVGMQRLESCASVITSSTSPRTHQ